MAKSNKPEPRDLDCDEHGTVSWEHMMCDACGALFHCDDAIVFSNDGRCPACNAPLLPRCSRDFTARPVCIKCAMERIAARGADVGKPDLDWTPRDPQSRPARKDMN